MGVSRATLMSEVEDSMRRQAVPARGFGLDQMTRQEIIDTAAWLLLAIESGDYDVAGEAEAQD